MNNSQLIANNIFFLRGDWCREISIDESTGKFHGSFHQSRKTNQDVAMTPCPSRVLILRSSHFFKWSGLQALFSYDVSKKTPVQLFPTFSGGWSWKLVAVTSRLLLFLGRWYCGFCKDGRSAAVSWAATITLVAEQMNNTVQHSAWIPIPSIILAKRLTQLDLRIIFS